MHVDRALDCYGMFCPMPIIKMKEEITKMSPGQVLAVVATDPGIEPDTISWCKMTGNEYLGLEKNGEEIKVLIRKK